MKLIEDHPGPVFNIRSDHDGNRILGKLRGKLRASLGIFQSSDARGHYKAVLMSPCTHENSPIFQSYVRQLSTNVDEFRAEVDQIGARQPRPTSDGELQPPLFSPGQ